MRKGQIGDARMKNEKLKKKIIASNKTELDDSVKEDIWYLYFNRLWSIEQITEKYAKILDYRQVKRIIFERLK